MIDIILSYYTTQIDVNETFKNKYEIPQFTRNIINRTTYNYIAWIYF